MVRALIKGGANPNLGVDRQLCDGMLALDIAFRHASERVIDLFLCSFAAIFIICFSQTVSVITVEFRLIVFIKRCKLSF